MIRDQALAASGLLVPTLGGPPVKPYQPTGVWEDATFGGKRYQAGQGGRALSPQPVHVLAAHRRPDDVLRRRPASDVHGEAGAHQLAAARADDAERRHLRRSLAGTRRARVTGCSADAGSTPGAGIPPRGGPAAAAAPKSRCCSKSIERVRKEFAADPAAARKFLAIGESKRNDKLDVVEHAGYAALCSTIFNLETSTKALTKRVTP